MPQRSPVIFWLLLAATLSVDAVAFSWALTEADYSFGFVTFDALMLSQVGLVCIWAALNLVKTTWTRAAPFLAVILASLAASLLGVEHVAGRYGLVEFIERFGGALVQHGLYAALLWTALWLLQRTALWRRRSGAVVEWQFSIANLLVAMTIVGVLAALMRSLDFFLDSAVENIGFILCSVIIAVTNTLMWNRLTPPRTLRLAGVLGVAMLLAGAISLTESFTRPSWQVFGAHYLIQAIVLSVWLNSAPILPASQTARGNAT